VPESSLIQRLKDRKLVQWSLAYLAGAWALVEATGMVVEQFQWPVVVGQGVAVAAFFGFFMVLVLAWYHGEKGRQRVSGPELLMIATLLLIAGIALSALRTRPERRETRETTALTPVGDSRPAIAVLPCENFSPDIADAYFADGIHDEILLRLQRISGLASIGRTSVLQYAESRPPTSRIARELGVGFVGECSLRKDADQIRLTFQLLDANSGRQIWAENYDRRLTAGGLFDIQSDIALRVASELSAVLTPEEQARLEVRPTRSLAAYDYYLLGRHALHTGAELGIRSAIDHFDEALRVDPTYAPGHAGLAEAYAALGYFNVVPPEQSWPLARAAAERALALDEGLAEAHTTLARVRAWFDWDWAGAEQEFRRAIALNPDDAESRQWFALFLAGIQEHDESVTQATRAVALDPRSLLARFFQMSSLVFAGRRDEALSLAERATADEPNEPLYHWFVALVNSSEERFEDALPPLLRMIDLMGDDVSDELGHLGYIYGRMGREAQAHDVLRRMTERSSGGAYVSPVAVSWVYIGLGDNDQAFAWLERGYDTRANWMLFLRVHPLLNPARSDPRFQDLAARMGL
jgi:TolB-like protein